MDRAGFRHDPAAEHTAFQAGTLNALMEGHFEGDLTVGELLQHGDLGIGTVDRLAGELVIVDGSAFVVDGAGVVADVPSSTKTPFAVVSRFSPTVEAELRGPMGLAEVIARVDGLLSTEISVLALRVHGDFTDLHLRSVHAQHRPYPPLLEVTRHQTEWDLPAARGTLVGFRFPDQVAGVEVPGYHLHFLSDDRAQGGHVLDLSLRRGVASVDGGDELHVELSQHIGLGVPGVADRAAIRAAERADPSGSRG
jgi:acetolactate decarboxylase